MGTTSPPQAGNFELLPAVRSRYPLWDEAVSAEAKQFRTYLRPGETVGTSTLDARPEMRVPLAGRSIYPFLTALAAGTLIVSLLFSFTLFVAGWIAPFAFLVLWHWPSPAARDMRHVKDVPADALPISTVVRSHGLHPPDYCGVLIAPAIALMEFGVLIVAYHYLRAGAEVWPPPGIKLPQLLPTIGFAALLISFIPSYLADSSIKMGKQGEMIVGYLIASALGLVYLVAQLVYYLDLPYTWQPNGYTFIFWTLAGFHFLYMLAMQIETAVVLVWAGHGGMRQERGSALMIPPRSASARSRRGRQMATRSRLPPAAASTAPVCAPA